MTSMPSWLDSLTDSAYALGAAAREAQHAARTAQLAHDTYSPDRLRLLNAEVHTSEHPTGTPFRPHDAAVFAIGDTLSKTTRVLRKLYLNTALAYAYGTVWAIRQVMDGAQPAAVRLRRTQDGHYMLPADLCPVPPALPALERWNGYAEFERARARLLEIEDAGTVADHLDAQPYLSDRDAADLHTALDVVSGHADAAYAYGVLAESALHFALLEPRAQHARTRS